jgi:hypothetical protein
MNSAPWAHLRALRPSRAIRERRWLVDWFEDVQVNLSAAERRAASLPARRSVKKNYQAAWLVKALQCIDLTTLGRRRHAGPCPPPLRQGEAPAAG